MNTLKVELQTIAAITSNPHVEHEDTDPLLQDSVTRLLENTMDLVNDWVITANSRTTNRRRWKIYELLEAIHNDLKSWRLHYRTLQHIQAIAQRIDDKISGN